MIAEAGDAHLPIRGRIRLQFQTYCCLAADRRCGHVTGVTNRSRFAIRGLLPDAIPGLQVLVGAAIPTLLQERSAC